VPVPRVGVVDNRKNCFVALPVGLPALV